MENDGLSDKSERDAHDDSDNAANGGRLTEESDIDQSDDLSPCLQATAYVEQNQEEMGEVRTERCLLTAAITCCVLKPSW